MEIDLYKYLLKLKKASEKVPLSIQKQKEEENDIISMEELEKEFYYFDECKTAFYNYFTILNLFVEKNIFINPLTRQPITKIIKVQFI